MKDETKSIPVTMRMKPSQVEELKRRAAEQHQSISQYGVEHIFQAAGLTDTQLQSVFRLLLQIQDTVRFQTKAEPSVKDSIFQECDDIWQSLKS